MSKEWENYDNTKKAILLITYAAKIINLNGNGSIDKIHLKQIFDGLDLSTENLNKLRLKLKDNKDECKKLLKIFK